MLSIKKIVGGIFCDLKKVFDKSRPRYFVVKLYGIKSKFKELIQSYLRNRYQRVVITSKNSHHDSFSRWGKIKCVVPQGSILHPLLFLFYINDLTKVAENNSKLFADDTSLSLILTT